MFTFDRLVNSSKNVPRSKTATIRGVAALWFPSTCSAEAKLFQNSTLTHIVTLLWNRVLPLIVKCVL